MTAGQSLLGGVVTHTRTQHAHAHAHTSAVKWGFGWGVLFSQFSGLGRILGFGGGGARRGGGGGENWEEGKCNSKVGGGMCGRSSGKYTVKRKVVPPGGCKGFSRLLSQYRGGRSLHLVRFASYHQLFLVTSPVRHGHQTSGVLEYLATQNKRRNKTKTSTAFSSIQAKRGLS
jgi:hypothetical protein